MAIGKSQRNGSDDWQSSLPKRERRPLTIDVDKVSRTIEIRRTGIENFREKVVIIAGGSRGSCSIFGQFGSPKSTRVRSLREPSGPSSPLRQVFQM
jgi:hypothetical protein